MRTPSPPEKWLIWNFKTNGNGIESSPVKKKRHTVADAFGFSSSDEEKETENNPKQPKLTSYGGFKMKLDQKRALGKIKSFAVSTRTRKPHNQ